MLNDNDQLRATDCRASLQQGAILSDLSLYCKNVLCLLAIRQLTALNKNGTLG
jgi:hypothetical protein